MDNRGNAVVGVVVLALIGILVLSAVIVGFGIGERRGESQYTGHVVDVVEDKGYVFTPNWVVMKTDQRSSDKQTYCIKPEDEDELLPKFYEAMETGDRYTVTYERPIWVYPGDCRNSDAVITDIERVNNSSQ